MGGVSFEDDCEFPTSFSNEDQARTVVLLGKTGNGKSSTGNSIIGRDVFESKFSSAGVTTTCEMQSTTFADTNRVINVIDTPGLFDYSGDVEYMGREIVKCIDMAKDGIHAVILVLSLRSRFSREEQGVIESLMNFFGNNISNYMIVAFTSADALENQTLDDYLRGCPNPLKETLKMCGNRCLLFDNKTESAAKKSSQLQKLIALVDVVINNNGGKPYTDELFAEVNKQKVKYLTRYGELDTLVGSSTKNMSEFKEQFKLITEMVELKLRVTTEWLEEQLAKERAARMKAEADAKDAQRKSEEEIRVLRDEMERARLKAEAESKDAQHKADEEMRILRDKLEKAKEKKKEGEKKKAEREAERLKEEQEWRARLERAEKETAELKNRGNCAIL